MDNKYDFEVEMVPIYTHDKLLVSGHEHGFVEAPKRRAILRTDNHAILGVVSEKYKILPHKQVVDAFRSVLSEHGDVKEKISVTKGGARLNLTYTLPSVQYEVRPGDFVSLQLMAVNSYDGLRMLQVVFGAFRLICANGAIVGERFINIEQRHVGKVGLDVASLAQQVGMLTKAFKDTMPTFKRMVDTDAGIGTDTLRGEAFSEDVVAIPEYLIAAAYDEFVRAKDGSVWGYFNAFTYAITHKMRRESPDLQVRYGRIAWQAAKALV